MIKSQKLLLTLCPLSAPVINYFFNRTSQLHPNIKASGFLNKQALERDHVVWHVGSEKNVCVCLLVLAGLSPG